MLNCLLAFTIFLPLLGACAIWSLAALGRNAARWMALAVSLVTLALSVFLTVQFLRVPAELTGLAIPWLGASSTIDVGFNIGLDGLSLWFFGLSALLTVTSVLVSWEAIEDRAPSFYGLLLLLESGMLGVFAARDII